MPPQIVRAKSLVAFAHLHELLLEYERDLPPELRHGSVSTLDGLRAAYAAPNAAFLARSGGEFAACVVVRRLDSATAVLARLFVRPRHRGGGIARALAERVVRYARAARYARVVLDTHKEMLRAAYRLYVSCGFTECPPYETVGYACPTFMELPLISEE